MEYQKKHLLENTPNQVSKFRTKSWIEINDQSRGMYNFISNIRFKNTMLKSSLCDYSDAYTLVKGRITITREGAGDAAKQADERNKGVIFKNCAPFIKCKSEIINAERDNVKDIDTLMPMYNLIEYSDNYSKTPGSLWQYYKDEAINNLTDSESFKFKIKRTGNSPNNDNKKDVEIIVPLKYLSNFWRTIETLLINCEVNLMLTWSSACAVTNSTGEGWFAIRDTKIYVPVEILSIQDNAKLLQQLKSGLKRTIYWNKYQSYPRTYTKNKYLNHLVDPSFQGVNRLFVLSFENEDGRTSHSEYYLPKVEIKDYNVKIDGENFLINQ